MVFIGATASIIAKAIMEGNATYKGLYLLNARWNTVSVKDVSKIFDTNQVINPNPTTGKVHLNFDVKQNSQISITLFDITGKQVKQIMNEFLPIGNYVKSFDLSMLNAGTYICQIQSNFFTKNLKIIKNK